MANNPKISGTDYVTIVYSVGDPTYPWYPFSQPLSTDTDAGANVTAGSLYINNSPTSTQLIDSLTKVATQLLELTRAFSDLSKDVAKLQKDVDFIKKELGAL
jgi:hypothetical protein